MEQKDYFKREIEKMTLLLMKLLGKVFGIEVLTEQQMQNLQQVLESDVDFSAIINSQNEDELIQLLIRDNYNEEQIELLAQIIMEIGIRSKEEYEYKERYMQKAIQLFSYLDKTTNTYSITRQNNIKMLQDRLAT